MGYNYLIFCLQPITCSNLLVLLNRLQKVVSSTVQNVFALPFSRQQFYLPKNMALDLIEKNHIPLRHQILMGHTINNKFIHVCCGMGENPPLHPSLVFLPEQTIK